MLPPCFVITFLKITFATNSACATLVFLFYGRNSVLTTDISNFHQATCFCKTRWAHSPNSDVFNEYLIVEPIVNNVRLFVNQKEKLELFAKKLYNIV